MKKQIVVGNYLDRMPFMVVVTIRAPGVFRRRHWTNLSAESETTLSGENLKFSLSLIFPSMYFTLDLYYYQQ